jgi:hypothetical protein
MSKWLNAKTGPDTALQTTKWRTGRLVGPMLRRKQPRNQTELVLGEQRGQQMVLLLQVGIKGSKQATPLNPDLNVMGITTTLHRNHS